MADGRPERDPKTRNASLASAPNREVVLHCTDEDNISGMPLAHDGRGPPSGPVCGTEVSPGLRCDAGTALPTAGWPWCDSRDSTGTNWMDGLSCNGSILLDEGRQAVEELKRELETWSCPQRS